MRISGKCGRFVEDRFPHGCTHRLACLVIAQGEVLFDLRIREVLKAFCPKRGVAQERCQFEEREAVFGEDIKRIPEQFIGTGSKGFEMPALFEDLREFRNLDKAFAAILLLQRIQANGEIAVRRFDDDQPLAQILFDSSFVSGNRRKNKASNIAVKIKARETTT